MTLRRSMIRCVRSGALAATLAAASLLTAAPAAAQDRCVMLDGIVASLPLARTVANEDARTGLAPLAASLSLSGLVEGGLDGMPDEQRDALLSYVVSLKEAAALSRAGAGAEAARLLQSRVTPDLFAGLNALDTGWACGSTFDDALQADSTDEMDSPAPPAQGPGRADGTASLPDTVGSVGDNAGSGTRPSDAEAEPNRSGGAYYGRDAIVGGDTMAFYMMVLVAMLVALLFYAQRRLRRRTVREARRVFDRPVRVFVDGRAHSMQLVDMSMNGAKIGHAAQLSEGGEVGLSIGGDWHSGTVRWSNAHFAGIKFRRPLDAGTLEAAFPDTA
ncbi:MAG: PilZ domain-containing protein [Pseudomonadota bacterium]